MVGWLGGSAKKGLCVLDFFCWGLLAKVFFFNEGKIVHVLCADTDLEMHACIIYYDDSNYTVYRRSTSAALTCFWNRNLEAAGVAFCHHGALLGRVQMCSEIEHRTDASAGNSLGILGELRLASATELYKHSPFANGKVT